MEEEYILNEIRSITTPIDCSHVEALTEIKGEQFGGEALLPNDTVGNIILPKETYYCAHFEVSGNLCAAVVANNKMLAIFTYDSSGIDNSLIYWRRLNY